MNEDIVLFEDNNTTVVLPSEVSSELVSSEIEEDSNENFNDITGNDISSGGLDNDLYISDRTASDEDSIEEELSSDEVESSEETSELQSESNSEITSGVQYVNAIDEDTVQAIHNINIGVGLILLFLMTVGFIWLLDFVVKKLNAYTG